MKKMRILVLKEKKEIAQWLPMYRLLTAMKLLVRLTYKWCGNSGEYCIVLDHDDH